MEILQINKENVKSIAEFLVENNDSCSDFASKFNGVLTLQVVDQKLTKYIVKNDSVIKVIVIDCINNKKSAISFFGELDICHNDLVSIFGQSSEYYERYDDAYEFHFRGTSSKDYYIMCFILKNEKKENNWRDRNLGNISFRVQV